VPLGRTGTEVRKLLDEHGLARTPENIAAVSESVQEEAPFATIAH